jgi:uncharacterized protein YbjT (DUF2867 family)
VNGIVELAGPEQFRLDELARRVLFANNDPRPVRADANARYFGAELAEHSLTAGSDARIAPTRFEDWLGRRAVRREQATPTHRAACSRLRMEGGR